MSATPLTGAFVEIVVVTDYGQTGEAEVVLDHTTEDIELERDPEAIDWIEHGNPRTQRREGAEETTGTFSMVVTDQGQNLIDAGMLDETTDEILRNVIHGAVRLYLYENQAELEADNHADVWTFEEAQFVFQTLTVPIDDISTIETEMWVHSRTINGMGEQPA